jgi:uncharacterized membrane protein
MKTETSYNTWATLLGAAALGATAMYLFDPVQGRRRRALVGDKLHSLAAQAGDAADVIGRDMGNRWAGVQARVGHAAGRVTGGRGEERRDDKLAARVRSALGRAVAHPHAISVCARGGRIELYGPVLADERQDLIDCVRDVAGVREVYDKLDVHEQPGDIPALQGKGRRARSRWSPLQDDWSPTLRILSVAGGVALGGYGAARRTPLATALAALGLALLARGAGNRPFAQMVGRRGIKLEKSIDIDAPIDTVFDVWTEYKNFPYFMSHVVDVRQLDDKRSHWVVKGPAGTRVEWDAIQTGYRRPSLLSWQTAPGSVVAHSGSVLFEPTDSGTRVTVRMSYQPPAGALGHGLAVLLGRDPKQELDDDLVRMKEFIESGTPPSDAAKPTPAQGPQPGQPLH